MKVLVTGGAGYVGTSLIPQLLASGHHVRVFDSLLWGGDPIIPFFSRPGFEFVRADIRDAAALSAACRDRDAVIHLAAIVGYPACRKAPDLARDVNIKGTANVIAATSRNQLILFASTGSNYGALEETCTEESELRPLSLYGQTKTIAESMIMGDRTGVAFRFATAFGLSPRLRLDLLINDFTYRAVTQGYLVVYEREFMRTFMHVRDIGRAFVLALDHPDVTKNQIFNAGSESMNLSKQRICEMIQARVPCYVHYSEVGEDQDKRNYLVSYEKIRSVGFETTITAEEGIDELVRGYQAISMTNPYCNA